MKHEHCRVGRKTLHGFRVKCECGARLSPVWNRSKENAKSDTIFWWDEIVLDETWKMIAESQRYQEGKKVACALMDSSPEMYDLSARTSVKLLLKSLGHKYENCIGEEKQVGK